MASIMVKKFFHHALQGALIRRGVIKVYELFVGGQYGGAQRLLLDLYDQSCTLCGPEHTFTEMIKLLLLKIVDAILEKLKKLKESLLMSAERLEVEHD